MSQETLWPIFKGEYWGYEVFVIELTSIKTVVQFSFPHLTHFETL